MHVLVASQASYPAGQLGWHEPAMHTSVPQQSVPEVQVAGVVHE
jgi:hypothetical protein